MRGSSILGFIIYIISWLVLYTVIKQFTTADNAAAIVSSIVVSLVIVWGFFSFRKNYRLLKAIPSNKDIPQDLIINGIRLNLTVRTIAFLKLIFWGGFYSILIILTYELLIAMPQREIENQKLRLSHSNFLVPYNAFFNNYKGTFKINITEFNEYRTGKILPINGETNQVDDIFWLLPSDLQPKDTSEIGTVVKIYREEKIIGHYSDKTEAIQRSSVIKMYDLKRGEKIGERGIAGKPPPDEKKHHGDDKGGDPNQQILIFLKGLPVR